MPNLTTFASVNPKRCLPDHLSLSDQVSFIPMADVTEGGEWLNHQTRRLESVLSGFTPFVEGDVLFAKITPCTENGKGAQAVGLKNGVGFGSTEFHILRAKEGVVPRFIYHLCQSRRLRLAAEQYMIGSAGQQRVQPGFFDHFNVPGLEKNEQSKAAQILDTLDTQIRQTEALIAKLETVKQGLLTDLLTRGIDENGQLRPPPEEAPELYKDSPLGRIPRGWRVSTVDSLSEMVTSGARDWARFYAEDGAKFIRIGNLTREHINFRLNSLVYVRPPSSGEGQRTQLETGDVLLSITADLGITAVVPEGFGDAYINQHIALIRPSHQKINARFLGQFLASPACQKLISGLNDAGAKAGLNLPTVRRILVANPERNEQDGIQSQLDSVDNRIRQAKTEKQKLQREKSGLMDDLLTGRVRVTPLLGTTKTVQTS
ncbi:restriction endonuclease subunit S [Guyparkeria halophila]|uniref:Restriction endonuclease subunit S n=1 Tax=Guyparkeria halophila TaxID=47960 RepID=A0A6I6D1Z8_9GAMM|nr:restriction endonuclease subunit S [Guyparkeria halophila]QGT78167.1 restriction endonuclease subunit S [Guyparkeria halophila]